MLVSTASFVVYPDRYCISFSKRDAISDSEVIAGARKAYVEAQDLGASQYRRWTRALVQPAASFATYKICSAYTRTVM